MKNSFIVKMQNAVILSQWFIISFLVILGFVFIYNLTKYNLKLLCKNLSFEEAQRLLPAHAYLDKNHDGIACNDLLP